MSQHVHQLDLFETYSSAAPSTSDGGGARRGDTCRNEGQRMGHLFAGGLGVQAKYHGQPPVPSSAGNALPAAGKKHDGDKAPIVQACLHYFPDALLGVAQVSAAGAKKYEVPYHDKNWKRVDGAIGRYSDALVRHTIQRDTFPYDPETKLHHAALAAWNALAVLQLILEQGTKLEQPV